MKYEIINPSDECYLEAPDDKTAIAAGLILGEGRYGLKSEDRTTTVLPVLFFGGAKEFLKEAFGGEDEYGHFIATNYGPIGKALLSVGLPRERTSMNDISARAHRIGTRLIERVSTTAQQVEEKKR
jgi:hypothetical protein